MSLSRIIEGVERKTTPRNQFVGFRKTIDSCSFMQFNGYSESSVPNHVLSVVNCLYTNVLTNWRERTLLPYSQGVITKRPVQARLFGGYSQLGGMEFVTFVQPVQ